MSKKTCKTVIETVHDGEQQLDILVADDTESDEIVFQITNSLGTFGVLASKHILSKIKNALLSRNKSKRAKNQLESLVSEYGLETLAAELEKLRD